MTAPQGEQLQLTFEDLIKDLPLHMAVLTSPPEMGVQMIHKAMSANPKVGRCCSSCCSSFLGNTFLFSPASTEWTTTVGLPSTWRWA